MHVYLFAELRLRFQHRAPLFLHLRQLTLNVLTAKLRIYGSVLALNVENRALLLLVAHVLLLALDGVLAVEGAEVALLLLLIKQIHLMMLTLPLIHPYLLAPLPLPIAALIQVALVRRRQQVLDFDILRIDVQTVDAHVVED